MRALGAIVALGMLMTVAPTSADVWTGCVPQVRDATGDAVLVGDGPLPGDAPDGTHVPVVLGCYTGELDDAEDEDGYLLAPGWHNVAGIRIAVWSLEGCFTATIHLHDTGVSSAGTLCEGERRDLIVLGVHEVGLHFTNGPGTYQFAFE